MKLSLNWVGLGLVAALAANACGSDDPATGPGDGNQVVGGSGGEGTGGTGGTTDDGGTGGTAGTGETTTTSALGKACTSDSQCDGLHCLTKDGGEYAGDGAPNGVCTVDCVADEGVACGEAGGTCIQFDADGAVLWCVEDCEPFSAVPPDGQAMDPTFCHGRLDHSCRPLQEGAACLPTCNNHMDCGTFWCDIGSGFCVENEPTGDAIGTPCDTKIIDQDIPDEERPEDTCAGRCIGQVDENDNLLGAACSGNCTAGTLGAVVNCGSDPTGAVVPHAACLWVFSAESGSGDFGACGQLCECGDDCLDPSAGCEDFATGTPYAEADYRRVFGQAGYCRSTPDNPRPDCGGGGGGGTGGGGTGGTGTGGTGTGGTGTGGTGTGGTGTGGTGAGGTGTGGTGAGGTGTGGTGGT